MALLPLQPANIIRQTRQTVNLARKMGLDKLDFSAYYLFEIYKDSLTLKHFLDGFPDRFPII
jgi:hypothetical protein